MSAKIVNGKEIAQRILKSTEKELSQLDKAPKLELFLSIDDPVIKSYVKIKEKYAKKLGVEFILSIAPDSNEKFKEVIKNSLADGVVVQLPLAKNFNEDVLGAINPQKDIDVLSPEAFKRYKKASLEEIENGATLVPPVAGAVFQILKEYKIDPQNKNILIVGCGKLVGRPVFELFKKFEAKNLECLDKNTDNQEFKDKLKKSDIIVSGAGVPSLIKASDVKEGAVLIDAGTSSQKSGSAILGDIDLSCAEKASIFSKTPGGVGPITIAMLYKNLLLAHKMQNNLL